MTARHRLTSVVAILMTCSGGCLDEGDSIAEELAIDQVFAADESKIYYWFGFPTQFWMSNSDGTGKTALPAGVYGEPSVSLHGGNRWFLRKQQIASETYPDGSPRLELFAVRSDGNAAFTVQLTTQADLQCVPSDPALRWRPGDAGISWKARRWSGGTVIEGGLYTADIAFDANGNVIGLMTQPSGPVIPALVNPNVLNIVNYDWSPDGSQIAYDSAGSDLRIATLSGSNQLLVQGQVTFPRWSPNGNKIAYRKLNDICTISPDGSGAKVAVKNASVPIWSPTGSHFAYYQETNVYKRALSSPPGMKGTNLTSDIVGAKGLVGWR